MATIVEVLVVSIEELRRWVRVNGTSHDQDLLDLLAAGMAAADGFCNRADWVADDPRLPLVRTWVKKFVTHNWERRGLGVDSVTVSGLGSVQFADQNERPDTTDIRHLRLNPGL